MDEAKRGVREIEHSGDVGIEAWGATQCELFENATRGLFALMSRIEPAAGPVSSPPRVPGRGGPVSEPPAALDSIERHIVVSSPNASELLVDWLSEVILSASTHGEVYSNVTMEAASETSARGVIRGERYDSTRHALRFDVKAATYYGLVCEQTADGYHARVVFDL